MKKVLSIMLALALSLCLFGCGDDPNAGYQEATDFKMQDLNGNTLSLKDLFGSPIVLNFWASWCPPCKSEMPDFEEAYRSYGSSVQFVMVSVDDTVYEAQGFISTSGYSFPVYHDSYGEGSVAYSISSIPQTLFINSDGYIVKSYSQMISAQELEDGINSIYTIK